MVRRLDVVISHTLSSQRCVRISSANRRHDVNTNDEDRRHPPGTQATDSATGKGFSLNAGCLKQHLRPPPSLVSAVILFILGEMMESKVAQAAAPSVTVSDSNGRERKEKKHKKRDKKRDKKEKKTKKKAVKPTTNPEFDKKRSQSFAMPVESALPLVRIQDELSLIYSSGARFSGSLYLASGTFTERV